MSITLKYDTTEIIVDSPEVGDTREYRDYSAHNLTLNQDPTVFKHVGALYNIVYRYTFNTITKVIRDQLYTFMTDTAGLRITLIDHYGYEHLGYIISPIIPYVDNSRDVIDGDYNITIDFMDISGDHDNSIINEVVLENCEVTSTTPTITFTFNLLQENGDDLLLETGDNILLEEQP